MTWVKTFAIGAPSFSFKDHLTQHKACCWCILNTPFIVSCGKPQTFNVQRSYNRANLLIFFMLTDLRLVTSLLRNNLTIVDLARNTSHGDKNIVAFLLVQINRVGISREWYLVVIGPTGIHS